MGMIGNHTTNWDRHYTVAQIALTAADLDKPLPPVFEALAHRGGQRLRPAEADVALGEVASNFRDLSWQDGTAIISLKLPHLGRDVLDVFHTLKDALEGGQMQAFSVTQHDEKVSCYGMAGEYRPSSYAPRGLRNPACRV